MRTYGAEIEFNGAVLVGCLATQDGRNVNGKLVLEAVEEAGETKLYAVRPPMKPDAVDSLHKHSSSSLPSEALEVTNKKYEDALQRIRELEAENNELRSWNREMEKRLLEFVELAFNKLKGDVGQQEKAEATDR